MASPSTSGRSPLLDISILKPETIKPEWAICPGYLDTALSIFQRNNQPFILVSTLAMGWSGSNNMPLKEVDILVRSSHLQALVDDLVESGEWEVSKNYGDMEGRSGNQTLVNRTSICDVWLKACFPNPAFEYLRFWPEELYHLSVDCNKVEVPDVHARNRIVLEEEYYRDPYQRFGPKLLRYYEEHNMPLLPPIQARAKIMRRDIPIFIPTIEDHLNALLDQMREQRRTKLFNGGVPSWQIKNYIRYLYLDWPPTRNWLLSTKIRERNLELMTERLDIFLRKPLLSCDRILQKTISRMPWELPIRPEFQHLVEQSIESGPAHGQQKPPDDSETADDSETNSDPQTTNDSDG